MNFSILFSANVKAVLSASGSFYPKNGKDHVKLDSYSIEVDVGKPHLQFDKIFGDNEELNIQTNKVINENISDLIVEVKPVVVDIIWQFVFGIVNRVFERYSFDDLFPK